MFNIKKDKILLFTSFIYQLILVLLKKITILQKTLTFEILHLKYCVGEILIKTRRKCQNRTNHDVNLRHVKSIKAPIEFL